MTFMPGHNFSGRTDSLRAFTGLDMAHAESPRPSAYIGPEVYNAISGLAASVEDEVRLHAGGSVETSVAAELFRRVGLDGLADRNPFVLSGGEQALLAVVSALALVPVSLAVDCALEQVDHVTKIALLRYLRRGTFPKTAIVMADNRLDECAEVTDGAPTVTPEPSGRPIDGRRLGPICSDIPLSLLSSEPRTLALESLRFRYPKGGFSLDDITLQLEPGRVYLMTGPIGAGKTTLAKLLCGVLRPARGRILSGATEYRPWLRPGQLVAYHFQNPDLQLFGTTVADEIQAGPRASGMRTDERRRRTDALLDAFGLSEVERQHPLDLPFVGRKRVAMAATLAMGCPWVVLDEPTLGQDRPSSEAVARVLEHAAAAGTGIMVISHSVWLRQRLSATVLQLDGGTISNARGTQSHSTR